MRSSVNEEGREKHISGAEGIYEQYQIEKVLKRFLRRAMEHPRGLPDKIVLTVEKIEGEIDYIEALPLKTHICKDEKEAFLFIKERLISLGISEKACCSAFEVIKNFEMRGATLIDLVTGERLEENKERGVRVSRVHMDKSKRKRILAKVKNLSNQPYRVIEALTIASKVAFCPEIVGELCISDNPDYTTGYIASRDFGYLRITNIKKRGDTYGGRAFFVKTPCNIEKLINFLEKVPVIVV